MTRLLSNKTSAAFFLGAYIAFFVTSVTHYHHYSLFNELALSNKHLEKSAQHFITNDFSFCLVSHFSNSILDLKFSSKNIKIFFAEPDQLVLNTKTELPQNSLTDCILYRAPPIEFS